MKRTEIDLLFKLNEEGAFENLLIPKDKLGEPLDLRGKKQIDLSLEESIRMKKYAAYLYENASDKQGV